MALVVADRVQELSVTSGTGTLTLTGALAGYQTFSTAIGNGNTTFYTIYDPTAFDWEVGIGTVGAGTLARTTVLSNSAGTTSPISFAGNSKFVFCTYPAEKSINYDANGVATIGEVLGYSDTGIVGSFASTVAGYNQVIVQNKSSATNASSNFNVSNDAGTAGNNYAELGINSSTFTGSGSFNIAGASYVASASTDLTVGTYGAYNVHFVTNSSTTDAMTIFNDGGISLGGFANPGIGNMAASKFVPGFTATTSAAGTTVLTEDSNYYQNLLGSTTQTFQLPDATTLLVGTTFIFDNDSTGILTITDNASATIDSVPTGGIDYIYLSNNSTVAGTWRKHAFIPASYDFNNSIASFGNASITNAVWTGTTIATGYGGTGLTTFSAANNALYSTGASTLTAGTLPIAAGGTGQTTANAAFNALAPSQTSNTGKYLTTDGTDTSWATVTQTTFSAGTTGFTPNTPTSGSVTLAGTLNAVNGGTGLTSYTTGDIIYASATNTLSKLGVGSNGQILTLASGVPTWAASTASTTRTVSNFTATASQTTFTVAYTVGLIDVYRNGVKLAAADFTATNGTSVILTTGANAGDIIETVAYSALSIGTGVTTFSGGTTGFTPASGSGNVTLAGTLNVANGGTGATTAAAAFNALNPMTTVGDIIYEGTGPAAARLGIGSAGQVLTVSSGIPAWTTLASSQWTTSGSDIYYNTGNVGIGTASPSYKLDVTSTAALRVSGGAGNAAGFEFCGNGNTYATTSVFVGQGGSSQGFIYNRANEGLYFGTNNTERMRIDSSGNVGIGNTPSGTYKLQVTGLISDSKGDVRAAPIQSKTSAYVLVATDAGQTISITTGGVTVNASIFSAGDMVSIFNNSGSSQTITQGASVTLRLSGTATTGNRTLAQYGITTLLCVIGGATPTFVISGAGLT